MPNLVWLHLSDWHQKGREFDREVVLNGLLDDIRERDNISPSLRKIDLIFFNGDLTFHGKVEEFIEAKNVFLKKMLKAANANETWRERFFLVPGNHDLDWEMFESQRQDIVSIMKSADKVAEWLTDDHLRQTLLDPFVNFNKFAGKFLKINHRHSAITPEYAFSKNIRIGGQRISVYCINSAWLSGRLKKRNGEIDDYGHLRVGEPQLVDSLRGLKASDIAIAVMHHPFEWLDLPDRDIAHGWLAKYCDFILFGHQHHAQIRAEISTTGSLIIIPAGACYDRRDYSNGYNFVCLDTDSRQGTIYFRKWISRQNIWGPDCDIVKDGKYVFQMPRTTVVPFQVAVAVVIKEGKVLLVRRKKREGDLWWQFPGGIIGDKEKDDEVAEREAFKEANIKCKAKSKLGQRIHPITKVLVHYWLCEYKKGEPKLKDTKDLDKAQWFPVKKGLELISKNVYRPVYNLLKKPK